MRKNISKAKKQFDGNVACVIDQEVTLHDDLSERLPSFFFNGEIGEYVRIDSNLLYRAAQLRNSQIMEAKHGMPVGFFTEPAKESLENELVRAKKLDNPEIYEMLMEGRLRLAFLINSVGGSVHVSNILENLPAYIEDKGGEAFHLVVL